MQNLEEIIRQTASWSVRRDGAGFKGVVECKHYKNGELWDAHDFPTIPLPTYEAARAAAREIAQALRYPKHVSHWG